MKLGGVNEVRKEKGERFICYLFKINLPLFFHVKGKKVSKERISYSTILINGGSSDVTE